MTYRRWNGVSRISNEDYAVMLLREPGIQFRHFEERPDGHCVWPRSFNHDPDGIRVVWSTKLRPQELRHALLVFIHPSPFLSRPGFELKRGQEAQLSCFEISRDDSKSTDVAENNSWELQGPGLVSKLISVYSPHEPDQALEFRFAVWMNMMPDLGVNTITTDDEITRGRVAVVEGNGDIILCFFDYTADLLAVIDGNVLDFEFLEQKISHVPPVYTNRRIVIHLLAAIQEAT